MTQTWKTLFVVGLLSLASFTARAADEKQPTAEQIAETVIFIYGTRPGLAQVRRSGMERGRIVRLREDGRNEEATYERRFVRGENLEKDKVRLDQKLPNMEFSLVYSGGRIWGRIGDAFFTPRQETIDEFTAEMRHGLDALLRYKENGSTLTLVGKDKQKNIDLWVLDVIDKEKNRTRYYISAKSWRVLWLEYEKPGVGLGTPPIKYKKSFHDYRYAQSTLVPFRTVLYVDGKVRQETQLLTVTYGVRMEDALFQSPEAAAAASTTP
ncbi:MAG: hypothetical protein C4334_00365 [Pyrinomonas sp.]|uniref:hypothetical protein n=1 Tax=Pyrinomonas sp. TaxID=2080306 RepID=UPI00331F72B0